MADKQNIRTYQLSLGTANECYSLLNLDISKQFDNFEEDKVYAIDLIKHNSIKKLNLEFARLIVRRPNDLLSLEFEFKNLVLRRGGSRNRHYLYFSKLDRDAECLIKVLLPSQHLAETIYESGELDDLSNDLVTKSRMTRESRLVFDVSRLITVGDSRRNRFPLQIDKLLDWGKWKLVVQERVDFSEKVTADEQLDYLDIKKTDDLSQAIEKIKKSVTKPTPWETSLELLPNLYFSPDKVGRDDLAKRYSFEEPNTLSGEGRDKAFWSIKYSSSETSSLRATWSDNISNMGGQKLGYLSNEQEDEFSFLDADDHWNIVALTSISGIPALLRDDKGASEGIDTNND